jgi:hypothetical protein
MKLTRIGEYWSDRRRSCRWIEVQKPCWILAGARWAGDLVIGCLIGELLVDQLRDCVWSWMLCARSFYTRNGEACKCHAHQRPWKSLRHPNGPTDRPENKGLWPTCWPVPHPPTQTSTQLPPPVVVVVFPTCYWLVFLSIRCRFVANLIFSGV